jgi:hypothetical protein
MRNRGSFRAVQRRHYWYSWRRNRRLRSRWRRNRSGASGGFLGGGFLSGLFLCRALGRCISLCNRLEMSANLFGRFEINRARMGFLFVDAEFGQVVEDDPGFDLEFAGQFVDAD